MFRLPVREDVELRLLEERHTAAVFAVVNQNRNYLRQWLAWVDATEAQDDTLSFIRASLERFSNNKGVVAGIWNQQRFAGVIDIHNLDWVNRKAEIGYWLSPPFQGRGIVGDACRVVVTYALGELDLNRVEIHCAVDNAKSCAIPPRLGFTLDGTLREAHLLHGRYHDLQVFGMLKRDWKPAVI